MTVRNTLVGAVDEEMLRFTVGKDPQLDLNLAEHDCIGTAAHVTMLSRLPRRCRVFTRAERDRIVVALTGQIRAIRRGSFRIDETEQDVHLAIETRLTRALGGLGKRVHTGRSRNDQVATALRLFAKDQLLGVLDEVAGLAEALARFAARHLRVRMAGRTHLQPAMPSSVGMWASAHAESLLEDGVLLVGAYILNNRSPLGSAAGYGTRLPLDRGLTASLLGFARPHRNVLYASNARGKCEWAIVQALAQVMSTLSRLAEDLILYSMPEFGYFALPAAYCTGSSIMPQKRNPDPLELIRAKASMVHAHAVAIGGIVGKLPSGYSRDLQEAKEPFMEALGTTRASVRVMTRLVRGLGVNVAALESGMRPEIFATDRALDLVAGGMAFRDAYDRVKQELATAGGIRVPVAADDRSRLAEHTNLPELDKDRRAMRAVAAAERKAFNQAVSRLLGVRYPAMTARRTR